MIAAPLRIDAFDQRSPTKSPSTKNSAAAAAPPGSFCYPAGRIPVPTSTRNTIPPILTATSQPPTTHPWCRLEICSECIVLLSSIRSCRQKP